MRTLIAGAGLADRIEVDSAGTGRWHIGECPDPRTVEAAQRRGIALDHRARLLTRADLDRFDLLIAMDRDNLRSLERMANAPHHADKLHLLRSFDPAAPAGAEVPDPWAGDERGFEHVLDVCEAACRGLLAHVRGRL